MADEAVRHQVAHRSIGARVARAGVVWLASVGLLALLSRTGPLRARVPLLFVPSAVPWAAFGYRLATPLHLWLSPPALVVATLVPWALARLGLLAAAHRAAVGQAAAVAAVTLVALEGALQLFNHVSPTFLFSSDSHHRDRGQPGARHYDEQLNSRGFNDRERQVVRPSEVQGRIVAIGDSFAVGVVPRRHNYLSLIAAELSADEPVEVINLGVGSIVALPGEAAAVYDDRQPSLPKERFLEIQVDRANLYDRHASALPAAAARFAGYLQEMHELSRRAGADLLVALIPDEIQIDPALQAEVAQALTASGVAYVDLLPSFADASAHGRVYKPQDTHWNVAGNRVAASVRVAALRRRLAMRGPAVRFRPSAQR